MMGIFEKIASIFKTPHIKAEMTPDYGGVVYTSSGTIVGPHNALTHPAFFAAVRLLSSTIASLPWSVYQRRDEGRIKATWLPLYRVLKIAPNSYQTAYNFFEQLTNHIFFYGNFFAIKQFTTRRTTEAVYKDVSSLHPIPDPSSVKVTLTAKGEKVYTIGDKTYTQDKIFHIAGYSRDGLVGVSLVRYLADTLGMGIAGRRYNAELLAHGGMPSVGLKIDKDLDQKSVDRLRSSFKETYGGPERRGVIVLHGGMDVKPLNLSPEDTQLLESLKLSDLDIARALGIPPHMIGLIEKASYASIEHQAIEFVQYCLRPWLVRIEQAMTSQLLPEASPYYIEASVEGLLRGDVESRFRAYSTARQWGWLSVNEIRRLENLADIPGGDEYLRPLNMQPVGGQLSLFEEEER